MLSVMSDKLCLKVQVLTIRDDLHFSCHQSLSIVGTVLDGVVEVLQTEREMMLRS